MRQQEDSTGRTFEDKEHLIIEKIQQIDWLNEKNQGILSALDQINLYIDSTNLEQHEIKMPQSDQVLELEMADGEVKYTMQTTLNSLLQENFNINYQITNSLSINSTQTPVPLIKTDNTISEELTLHDLVLSYTRADSARTIKPTVLPRQFPRITDIVYYVHDHLGNTRVTYSVESFCTTYNLEGVFDYYPYGKILREYQPNQTEKYLTTHHQRDEETTLDYRYARFYDSDLGRFLSIDPMAADYASWSGYNYVVGNPVAFTDPTGEDPVKKFAKTVFKNTIKRKGRLDLKADFIQTFTDYADAAATLGDGVWTVDDLTTAFELITDIEVKEIKAAKKWLTDFVGGADNLQRGSMPKEGIYEFEHFLKKQNPNNDIGYVGQSVDLPTRLGTHDRKKIITDYTTIKTKEVLGGKTQREIAETKNLTNKGGANTGTEPNSAVSNKRRPVSYQREQILREQGIWLD